MSRSSRGSLAQTQRAGPGLRLRRSPGLAARPDPDLSGPEQRRGLPIPVSSRVGSASGTVARAGCYTALQSRGGDGFSPSSRSRSLGWMWTARGDPPEGSRNTPQERQKIQFSCSPNQFGSNVRVPLSATLASAPSLKSTRGRPLALVSTSSGASNTCSSRSRRYTSKGGPTRTHLPL